MDLQFEELDRRSTELGEISLRRRHDPTLGVAVFEVKLDDEFLMSSHFTEAEVALSRLALAVVAGEQLDVAVGGLGLGYTAAAALEEPRVRHVEVLEISDAVIEWHDRRLLPTSTALVDSPRCSLVHADFFVEVGRWAHQATPRFDAVLLDIDHSPRRLLHERHGALYSPEGLQQLAGVVRPGGCFGLWSDDPPDDEVLAALEHAFGSAEAHVVSFPNPYVGGDAENTVYLARR